jgi:hypothetical protein
MSLPNIMKLKKLTFEAYSDRERKKSIGKFKVMYNPTTFSQRYDIGYSKYDPSDPMAQYSFSKPRVLNLKLVLDGTHVEQMGLLGSLKTVSQRVKEFLKLTYQVNGNTHEPNFLRVEWGGEDDGGLDFKCRLSSVDVTYTAFERDGSPLRAELDVALVSDEEVAAQAAKLRKNSPDLTHLRIVKSGDTLPLLCKDIYGSTHYYMRVAEFNQLDDFRNLVLGQSLRFPPLEN